MISLQNAKGDGSRKSYKLTNAQARQFRVQQHQEKKVKINIHVHIFNLIVGWEKKKNPFLCRERG